MFEHAKTALGVAADMLYPPAIYCVACGNLIDGSRPYAICDRCRREIDWRLGELPSGHEFGRGFYCAVYAGPVKSMIRDMKYRDKPYIAQYAAEAMADRAAGEAAMENADIIAPVPMYAAKKRRRGYNQAELIAANLAGLLEIPCVPNLLTKTKPTDALSAKNRDERLLAFSDAFAVSRDPKFNLGNIASGKNAPLPAEISLREKNILLIDDVFTTGATADACARTLLDAGAKTVSLLVFAAGAF